VVVLVVEEKILVDTLIADSPMIPFPNGDFISPTMSRIGIRNRAAPYIRLMIGEISIQ